LKQGIRREIVNYKYLLLLVVNVLTVGCALVPNTSMIHDSKGKVISGSITCLEKIKIGGLDQWLLIRGKSTNNPILLFLHGGPGSAEWPLARDYNLELENHFIIVYWEQRGAGKSYSSKTPNMNVKQFISDTYDIVQYLRKRFNQEKIFLIGHSWGSLIGILTVQKYPEFFHAYIGIGQFVSGKEQEKISYKYVMDMAIKNNNKKAIKELNQINSPEQPYGTIDQKGKWYQQLMTQRKWLLNFGGCFYGEKNHNKWTIQFFRTPEYSVMDLIKWVQGNTFSIKTLWPEIMQHDLFKQVPKLEIPVYFLVGKHDYNTPFELVEKYFNQLAAPKKELIWFDNSAHSPMYEEAYKFNDVLIKKIRQEINNTDLIIKK
jgi:pimeloyl-ACP methyl ester carboxylesterase